LGPLQDNAGESIERQVYRSIKEALMAGLLTPGSAITGRSIALALGISPSPVRDALKRLEADGVIEGRSKSAYFVKKLTRETYFKILDLRRKIEGYAASLAAKNAKPNDIRHLEMLNAKYVDARNASEMIRLNYQFHFGIYRLANSDVLSDVISNLWIRTGPIMHLYLSAYEGERVANNHAKIIAALKKGDSEAAEIALQRDLGEAIAVIAPRLEMQ
jgi:GntR family colanic acid and biofilm gene transcriptional regulator